jgi:hypothetical protein
MNDDIKQLQEGVESAKERVANWISVLKEREAELEAAVKNAFQPFDLVIKVTNRGQAKALRRLAGADVRMADALYGVARGEYDRLDAGSAISTALDPLFRHIELNGDYRP